MKLLIDYCTVAYGRGYEKNYDPHLTALLRIGTSADRKTAQWFDFYPV